MTSVNPKKLLRKNPFLLAPMDDVTDIGFRELCEKKGSAYTTTELTSIDALVRDKVIKSRFEKGNLKVNSVQLFGSNPETFVEALKKVENEADIIDVNFGCPSPKVMGNDSGASLLKDPKNVGKIIEKLVKYSDKPITAKIRLGYTESTYRDVAKEIEDAGAEILAVHGRTAKQKYTGNANWDAIKEIYSDLKIPIIGNGDIKQEEDIDKYLNSHCDALMIGRAAIGNPIIFERFNYYYKNHKKLEIESYKEIQKKLFLEYLETIKKYDMHNLKIKTQRQSMWFFKGIEGIKNLRVKLQQTESIDEILEIINNF